jgi:hypothetical protein
MAAVAVLQRGHASCPRMTGLMRALHVSQTIHDFAYTAEHLPGVANTAADLLSRNNVPAFLALHAPPDSALPLAHCIITPQDWLELLRRCN